MCACACMRTRAHVHVIGRGGGGEGGYPDTVAARDRYDTSIASEGPACFLGSDCDGGNDSGADVSTTVSTVDDATAAAAAAATSTNVEDFIYRLQEFIV